MTIPELKPEQRIRIVQKIDTRTGAWPTEVEGKVVWCKAQPTGSWFAHGKHDKLWLMRLRLQKDDGELVDLVLEPDSKIEILEPTVKK